MKTATLLLLAAFATTACSRTAMAQAVAEPPVAADQQFEIPATDDGLPGDGPIRRYDWFKNLWQERRAAFAKEVATRQNTVVFFGDSITQGWGDIDKAFDGIKSANRGISGDTTRGMLIRMEEDVLSLNPSAVIMLMGTNDIEEQGTPDQISANTKLIVAAIKKHNAEVPIVLCSVFPSSAEKARPNETIRELNKLNEKAFAGDAQVTILDTWKLFANKQGDAKKEEFPDLLHPNELGYAKWAKALQPLLETHGLVPVAKDEWKPEEGFEALFNGKDLTGWQVRKTTDAEKRGAARWQKNDPNAPPWPIVTEAKTYDGKTATDDGRFVAKNGRIVVTIPPEGRKVQQLFTTSSYPDDFVLKLEFRASPNADSGVFIRGKQLQCRDFVTAGPYKKLKKYRPQDWNELEIVVKGRAARCTCNGEVLEAEFAIPANGPIGLEADRGQMEYRRIQVAWAPGP